MSAELMGGRIVLTPRPARARTPALEVAMLGHCPGRVRPERIGCQAREDLHRLGYRDIPLCGSDGEVPTAAGADWIWHRPLPLRSAAEFDDIFPDALNEPTCYHSRLAGARAWLPRAVADFFTAGGEKLWIVPVPDIEPDRSGNGGTDFLPRPDARLADPEQLRGLDAALAIPEIGLVTLPDLERLEVPANLPDTPRKRLPNPPPVFLPCAHDTSDHVRERRRSESMPTPSPVLGLARILTAVGAALERRRPDVQCLYTLPLAYDRAADRPGLDPAALRALRDLLDDPARAPALRRIQMLYPYLRGPGYRLRSACGLVAGMQAGVAAREGVWRSMAGRDLPSDGRPFPPLDPAEVARLRADPGIGVFTVVHDALVLDDERLAVPALPVADYRGVSDPAWLSPHRSGEVARFVGFLMRQLRRLGETLVFDNVVDDTRPRLLLDSFFGALYRAGALRGRRSEDAYNITRLGSADNAIAYAIEIAPSIPIDRVHLTFANLNGQWDIDLGHG
ncbi:MAG: hypothetical protein P8009_09770 [Gammaproteobacteria bacterium]